MAKQKETSNSTAIVSTAKRSYEQALAVLAPDTPGMRQLRELTTAIDASNQLNTLRRYKNELRRKAFCPGYWHGQPNRECPQTRSERKCGLCDTCFKRFRKANGDDGFVENVRKRLKLATLAADEDDTDD